MSRLGGLVSFRGSQSRHPDDSACGRRQAARPHDAAPGPAGQIWYTAQQQGALGIIDIASGKVRQVPLGPNSAPHGVIQAKDGTAWITDGGQNAIVRYDPKTNVVPGGSTPR